MAYPKTEELVNWEELNKVLKEENGSLEFQTAHELREKNSQAPTKQNENRSPHVNNESTDSSTTNAVKLKSLSSVTIAATLASQLRLAPKGIQTNKKQHFSLQGGNLPLNSDDEDQNKGKNFAIEVEIPDLANLPLNSIKVDLQNKGKILVRFEGKIIEVEKSHRKKKLESIVDLEVFHKTGWGSGSYRIKPVNCTPKKCSGCPHLYLTFRWYEGKKQKEKNIGKASRPGAIV